MSYTTIPQMFAQIVENNKTRADKPAFLRKVRGAYTPFTYSELAEWVTAFAAGLHSMGMSKGDMIGVVSENRIEWVVADFAAAGIGVIVVPVFPTLTANQEQYIFTHCGARMLLVSNKFQLAKILQIRDALPALQWIVVMNSDIPADDPMIISYSEVLQRGRAQAAREQWFAEQCHTVQPNDLLTIIYTSGTTGEPKGVMLSHKNIVANMKGGLEYIPIRSDDVLLSYLPLCHCFERLAGYYCVFVSGATIAFADSIETVAENLKEVRPTIMTSVPRLFERIRGKVLAAVEKKTPREQKIFHWAIEVGKEYHKRKLQGGIPAVLKLQYLLADRLALATVRERLGGRMRLFASGGAALPVEIGEFFLAVGLPILEGYGLTEASPVIAVNREQDLQLGTVGRPLRNVQVRLASDGEILAKGDSIMLGYFNNEEATREVLDEDGWLHTGDIGEFTPQGYLRITDRKKNIFISSGGKNIAPLPVEEALLQSRLIDQVMLIGENREYCTALIVPNREAVDVVLEQRNVELYPDEDAVQHKAVIDAIQQDIDYLLRDFSKYEKVRKFVILREPFSVENGTMTPTLKIKRHVVEQQYGTAIEQMYTGIAV